MAPAITSVAVGLVLNILFSYLEVMCVKKRTCCWLTGLECVTLCSAIAVAGFFIFLQGMIQFNFEVAFWLCFVANIIVLCCFLIYYKCVRNALADRYESECSSFSRGTFEHSPEENEEESNGNSSSGTVLPPLAPVEENKRGLECAHAMNLYQDIEGDIVQCLLLGVTQIILLGIYIWSIYETGMAGLDSLSKNAYRYFYLGVVVQIGYCSGKGFWKRQNQNREFWKTIRKHTWDGKSFHLDHSCVHGQHHVVMPRTCRTPWVIGVDRDDIDYRICWRLTVRYCLDTIVNEVGVPTIMLALPIRLAASEEPWEFLANAVSAYYIVTLDDYASTAPVYILERDETSDLESGHDASVVPESIDVENFDTAHGSLSSMGDSSTSHPRATEESHAE
jgi:hypothetical protein